MSGFADVFNVIASQQKVAAAQAAAREGLVTVEAELLDAIRSKMQTHELAAAAVTALQLACVLARRAGWDMGKAAKECMGMWGRTSFIEPDEPDTLTTER